MSDTQEKVPEAGKQDAEFSLSHSGALAPLLVLFGLTVLAITIIILHAEIPKPEVGSEASKAFGPADFKERLSQFDPIAGLEGAGAGKLFPVPKPPFSEGIFPCNDCHEASTANPERRELEEHTEIRLNHDEEHRWCLDCHDQSDRNSLRLASGKLVAFEESYQLCGQCHGPQYRDWKTGIHGKRTGYWDGPKRYLLCVNCHNPHSPKYMDLTPFPPPVRPQYLRGQEHGVVTARPAHPAKTSTPAPAKEESHG